MEMIAVKFKIMEMLTNGHFVTMDNCRGVLNDHSTFIVQNPSVVYAYSIEYVSLSKKSREVSEGSQAL